MNEKKSLRRIGGFVLAVALVSGVALLSGTTAQAQWHGGRFHGGGFRTRVFIGPYWGRGPYWYYGYPYGRYSPYFFSSDEAAEGQGYHDGLKTGTNDARRGQSYDPERSHYYQDAGFGNFAEAYREGFDRGYSAGFHS